MIITLTGLAALAGHLALGVAPDVPLTVALAGATEVGAAAGTVLAQRVRRRLARRSNPAA